MKYKNLPALLYPKPPWMEPLAAGALEALVALFCFVMAWGTQRADGNWRFLVQDHASPYWLGDTAWQRF